MYFRRRYYSLRSSYTITYGRFPDLMMETQKLSPETQMTTGGIKGEEDEDDDEKRDKTEDEEGFHVLVINDSDTMRLRYVSLGEPRKRKALIQDDDI